MKKLYTLALLTLVSIYGVKAQEAIYETNIQRISLPVNSIASPLVTVQDTLEAGFFSTIATDVFCNTISLYCDSGGLTPAGNCRNGFRTGNNKRGDREVLTKYRRPDEAGTVIGTFIRTGGKTQTTASTQTFAVVYGVDSMGLPDTTDRSLSDAVPMSRVADGTTYTFYSFSNPPIYVDSFFVGLVLPQVAGDTIAIFTSRLGGTGHPLACSAPYPDRLFIRKPDGSFVLSRYRGTLTFPGEIETVMATIIQYDLAVATKDLLGKLVKIAPIPSMGTIMVTLPNNIKGATYWQIVSADGKTVSASIGKTDSAFFEIERGKLPAGVYTLRLNTAGGPVNKRIIFAD